MNEYFYLLWLPELILLDYQVDSYIFFTNNATLEYFFQQFKFYYLTYFYCIYWSSRKMQDNDENNMCF